MRIVSVTSFVAIISLAVISFAGCSKKDASKANDEEASKLDKLDKKGGGVISHDVAVKSGKKIACKDWVSDPKKFGAGLKAAGMGGPPEWLKETAKKTKKKTKDGEEEEEIDWDTVIPKDTRARHKKSGLTSACDIVRPGKPPSMKKQEEMSKASGMLGVLPGDTWCNLRAYCSAAEQKNYAKICRAKGDGYKVNKDLGVTACVRTTIAGKYDSFSYRLVDKDTKCLMEVRGGNSIRSEAKVRACAKMAMEAFTKDTLKKAK